MVIIKIAKAVDEEFECEDPSLEKPGKEYVRPCERYKEILWNCKTFRSRIHQYYVYGEFLDCSEHKSNYLSCLEYRKTKDPSKLDPVIEWEKSFIKIRMRTVEQNTTWEPRETPPNEFNSQLPEYLAKRAQESQFRKAQESR